MNDQSGTPPEEDGQAHWERRYREALDSLEAQGHEAREMERRLRRALAQVAMAGMGGDSQLSRYLEEIRQNARGDAALEEVLDTIERMGRFLRHQAEKDIRLPETGGSMEQVLRRLLLQILMLIKTRHPDDETLLSLQSRLQDAGTRELKQTAEALENQLLETFGQVEKENRGVSRWLRRGGKQQGDNDAGVAAVSSLLNSLSQRLPPEETQALTRQLEQEGSQALLPVCRRLVSLVEGALDTAAVPGDNTPQTPARPGESANDDGEQTGSPAQGPTAKPRKTIKAGKHVLAQLRFPEELREEADALAKEARQALADPAGIANWLEATADLLQRFQGAVDRERQALKKFLETVLGRLSELEGFVGSERASRARTAAAGRKVDAALERDLHDIRTAMDQKQDMGSLGKAINERLNRLNKHLNRRQRIEADANSEAEERMAAMEQRLEQMEAEANQLRQRLKKAQDRSAIDPLTDLPNRRGYEKRLAYEVERQRRHDRPLSLAVCDLDEFKLVNDQLGHLAGDEALGQVADLIRETLRTTDFAARFGGEEFVILLPETELEAARQVAERLRVMIQDAGFEHEGVRYPLTLSVGVAEFGEQEPPEKVFRRADQAVLDAKEQGRNRVVVAMEDAA
ncbi:diguanylate cyclase [Natronospira proteinivora]|uniref:diguanylate cyclase n=1 Tax=Natronospira proteinivora TaxID=1807133 RepID=A0ABT1G944_9GAMM|nr:GGDEF domain-containing protein [Natronospira proteinivora]MCP1727832.1 diguanylate cyclase [Natronospira proteinivora]